MDYRWEALVGVVGVLTLFIPVFVAMLAAGRIHEQSKAARAQRIADYRKSPASRLLILDDTARF